jgi:hypothetical protein
MSGVFSIASHWVLQYLPEVVMHEQTGRADFLTVSLVISFLLVSDHDRVIQDGMLEHQPKAFLYKKEHISILSQCGNRGVESNTATSEIGPAARTGSD